MSKMRFEEFAINCTQKKTPEPSDYSTYIGLEHMDTKDIHVHRWGSDVPIIGEKLVMHKGDILLGKRNAYLRRAAIAPHDGIFSAHGMILRPKTEVVDYDFFALFIASDYFFDEAIRISVGSLSPTINWKDLKGLEFNIPSLEKQKELAEVLWSINDTIDSYKDLLRQSDELIKSRFIEMFGDPVENEKGWQTKKLNDVCPVNRFRGHVENADGKVWLLNLDMVESNTGSVIDYLYEDETKINSSTISFDTDCILYSKLRPYLNKVVVPVKSGYATSEMISMNARNVNRQFLAALLRTNSFVSFANATAYGAKMPRASVDGIKNFDLIMPPRELQDEFGMLVEQIDKSKLILQDNIAKLEAVYKKIMSKYLKKED